MSDRPRPYGLDAKLDRLERELARLAAELASVRALVSPEAPAPGRAPVPEPPAPAPPVAPPPAPAPAPPAELPAPPVAPPPAPTPPVEPQFPPAPVPVAAPTPPRPPRRPPPPPRRSFGQLARDWDLVGARGFAIAGGAVMALGIGLFFVLAANRGWINAELRVALGAAASALVFGAGLLLRARYGQYWSALAAVGAGIAGAYATLAAAAARYDLVPDALALPLGGVIAAAGTVVAVRWRSQVIASIGLLGAALAPALQALDTDMTWESAAFAVIVLVAVGSVAVPRGWRELMISASVIVAAQVEWLAADPAPVGAGTVTVAAAFALGLLGISVGRQIAVKQAEIDPIALPYAVASFGIALIFALQLFDERTDRGTALLGAAAVWAVVFAGLQWWRRLPDLALVVGSSALALAAVGTADLLSDAALTIAWAAEALVLATLARRLGDVRLQTMGIVYAALASISALASDGKPRFLFDEAADHLAGALPLAAAAAAAIGAGILVPATYRARTEAGLFAFVAELRRELGTHRQGVREALVFAGAALATLSAAFLLVSISFEWGHVAASVIAAAVGAGFLGAAGRLRSDALAVAAFAWLGVVLIEAWYDGDRFEVEVGASDWTSSGGWSVIAASAGILGGAYAYRVLQPERRALDIVCGIAVGLAFVSAWVGVAWLNSSDTRIGIGLLALALVYAGLSAGVFRRDRMRTLSTILWSLALVALIGAELLLIDDEVARTVALAATGLVIGALAGPLRESRLWLAGGSLVLVTSLGSLLFQVQPFLDEGELSRRLALASGACAVAAALLAGLVWGERRWRDLNTVLWADGILALLATERVLLDDWRATAFAVALTGGALALLAHPLGESRLWLAGAAVVGVTTYATIANFTPPSHFFTASESPAEGLWVLLACIFGLVVLAFSTPVEQRRFGVTAVAGSVALYAVSLGILEIAEWISTASVETDFERGHTAVSALWALVGLGLLVAGLLRGSSAIRYGGLALFGLSLAKIFLYDLAELSSVARAFSFIFVGGLLLAGGFFLQRLSDRMGPRHP